MSLFKNPGEDRYDALLAENTFVHDIQLTIETALEAAEMSQADLAKELNVSQARVSQMLADNGKNLRARTIARIAFALKRKPFIDFVDGASDWIVTDISEEELADSQFFAAWVDSACEALDVTNPVFCSNDWKPHIEAMPIDRLVAA